MRHEVRVKTDKNKYYLYTAYCLEGRCTLEQSDRAGMVRAAAERHSLEKGHEVIVGYILCRERDKNTIS